jgi:glutamate synthase (NADPH/NADH) small chain
MSNTPLTPGIVAARLPAGKIAENFSDHTPPLDRHEAQVAADRCYFCHDAPCITACPTAIDIPLFIRQIATGTPDAAAKQGIGSAAGSPFAGTRASPPDAVDTL